MKAKKEIKTGVRKSRPPTECLSGSKNTEEKMAQFICSDTLDFYRKNTNSAHVIAQREYEHLDRFHRIICDAAVAEGAFIVLDI